MITYAYTAVSKASGETIKAEVQADSDQAAAKLLIAQNLFPITIVPKGEGGIKLPFQDRISSKDKVIFARQLATLINAGLPLAQSLRTVTGQMTNKNLKVVLEDIRHNVEGGSSLADAFRRHPKVFNRTFVSLVAAGETSGTLDKTLTRVATQQEKDAQIVSKIRGAFLYPIIVLAVVVAVLIFMLTTVLPQIGGLYKDLHKTLPTITLVLLAISTFVTRFWWLSLLILGGAIYGVRTWFATPQGQRFFDRVKLNVPVIKILLQKVYMARFARTLGTLLASGIPVLEALSIVSDAVNNSILQEGIGRAATLVKGGKALSLALERDDNFTVLVPQMIKIGEESGTIDQMLDKVASFYEEEVDEAVKNLSATIEPVLMIVMGLLVGVIIAAILLPVYSLVGSGVTGLK